MFLGLAPREPRLGVGRFHPVQPIDHVLHEPLRLGEHGPIGQHDLNDAPLVFIANLGATAAWRNNVTGFLIDGLSYYRFEDVTLNK